MRYAVARFAAFPVLWSLSGDGEYGEELAKWEAIGTALETADSYGHPTTNHLEPGSNWLRLFQQSPWHDFHMWQTGHRRSATADIAALSLAHAHPKPAKATVNGEPWYEAHPAHDTPEYGPVFTSQEVRYAFWTSILCGATLGHTYGAQGIWNWKRPGDDETPLAGPQIGPTWQESLHLPGAGQCGLGAALLRQLPWPQLVPRPELVQLDPSRAGQERPSCAVIPGRVRLIYLPYGGTVHVKGLAPGDWRGRWWNPRSGDEAVIGTLTLPRARVWSTSTPSDGDWLLIVENDEHR